MAKRGRPKKNSGIDIAKLSKGYLRKLTALRKSLGDAIADSAFAQWLQDQPTKHAGGDPNVEKLIELVRKHGIKIPRGAGLIIRRGGPRIFVEPAPARMQATKKAKRMSKGEGGGGVHVGGGKRAKRSPKAAA
jgi:hypothetical protein